jgi:DNA-directed RNA polymerase specialized sigma24 family protein
VYDSDEIVSSVLRRMDVLAADGQVRPRSEGELRALIKTIAQNTAVTRTRMMERAKALMGEDGGYARALMERLARYESDDRAALLVYRMAASLKKAEDRQLLLLVMRGATHRAIAGLLGTTEDASRQRWKKVREELEARFAQGEFDDGQARG